jgi:hypothetical protein
MRESLVGTPRPARHRHAPLTVNEGAVQARGKSHHWLLARGEPGATVLEQRQAPRRTATEASATLDEPNQTGAVLEGCPGVGNAQAPGSVLRIARSYVRAMASNV